MQQAAAEDVFARGVSTQSSGDRRVSGSQAPVCAPVSPYPSRRSAGAGAATVTSPQGARRRVSGVVTAPGGPVDTDEARPGWIAGALAAESAWTPSAAAAVAVTVTPGPGEVAVSPLSPTKRRSGAGSGAGRHRSGGGGGGGDGGGGSVWATAEAVWDDDPAKPRVYVHTHTHTQTHTHTHLQ